MSNTDKCDTEECVEAATVAVSADEPGSMDAWFCKHCARRALTVDPQLKSWSLS